MVEVLPITFYWQPDKLGIYLSSLMAFRPCLTAGLAFSITLGAYFWTELYLLIALSTLSLRGEPFCNKDNPNHFMVFTKRRKK